MSENYDNENGEYRAPLENKSYTDEVVKKNNISLLTNTITIILLIIVFFLLYAAITNKKPAYKAVKSDDVIILQWDPLDWFSLKKNPLLYKNFSDYLIDDPAEYTDYIKQPSKIGVEANQLYFDKTLALVKKFYVNKTNNQVLLRSIEKELNMLFAEIHKQNPKMQKISPLDLSGTDINNGLINLIVNKYSNKVNPNLLGFAAIRGLFKGVGDPHSFVLPSEDYKAMMERLEDKSFGGIGVYIEISETHNNTLMVVEPVEGTPAYKAGLLPGDIITNIDGHPTKNVDINISMSRIRGKKGTSVKLDVQRKQQKLSFNVIRDDIKITSVSHKMLKDGIGYIRIRQFAANTVTEFENAFLDLKSKGDFKALIVDLRNNSGGFLDAGLTLSGIFLPPESIVMKKMERNHVVSNFYGGLDNRITIPTIVLANRLSASASEIMAAALKENNIAYIVGEKTFGKGSVQQIFHQPDGSAVKITIANFMSPQGNLINKKGVTPDYTVEMPPKDVGKEKDTQLAKAQSLLIKTINGESLASPEGKAI